ETEVPADISVPEREQVIRSKDYLKQHQKKESTIKTPIFGDAEKGKYRCKDCANIFYKPKSDTKTKICQKCANKKDNSKARTLNKTSKAILERFNKSGSNSDFN